MATAPTTVILDTDIGDDIDDTWALAMLLQSPEVEVALVTTALADVCAKADLTAKFLESVGRTEVPIGIGVPADSPALKQAAWLDGYDRAAYPGVIHDDGIGAMIGAIHAAQGPVTICAIGPQTNIAEALRRDPSIAAKARIVAMAGSIDVDYHGKQACVPEWNIMGDLAAARAVFAAPWDITLAPLDITCSLMIRGERYRRVERSASPMARAVVENYAAWTLRNDYPEDSSSVLHDTVAVYLTYAEQCVDIETLHLTIDDDGRTVRSESGRPVRCALRWRDRNAFEELVVTRICDRT